MSQENTPNAVDIRHLQAQWEHARQAQEDIAGQLQGVINATVDGIMAITDRGIIQWLNPAALRIFGYASEEVIGNNVSMLMPEPDRSRHDGYLKNYLTTGVRKIIGIGREVHGRRKDGSIFPMDLAVSEVRLKDRILFTGIIRDITQRKEAEHALIEARDAAEAASRAKDQFLAMVSHELRTPLNPILTAVSFLQNRTDLPEDVREEIVSIRRNVEQESHLVDDLLNLTRLTRGKIDLHHEAVDAHAVVREVLDTFRNDIESKDIEQSLALRSREHLIWADPIRIRQVLFNLISNAVKFTPAGGRIAIRSSLPHAGRLRLEIADSGIGIEPEALERLFRPFEQAEKSITRQFGGLGLGLAIAKSLVDLHGGALQAQSPGKGQGATFSLELKTVEADVITAATNARPSGDAPRVLLVEDHRDTLRVMSKLLRAMGFDVVSATCVSEALRLCEQDGFEILVSDIGLPDGSGLDIIQSIRAIHPIKAIAISGFGQPEDVKRSRDAGFADHLIKPIDFERLGNVMKHLVAA